MKKLHLTHDQMLSRWRLAKGFTQLQNGLLSADSSDPFFEAAIAGWYHNLLHNAPVDLLAPLDFAEGTGPLPDPTGGCVTVPLPTGTVRLTGVRLSSWSSDALIITPDHPLARLQANPLTRALTRCPVAIVLPGGFVALYPAASGDSLVKFEAAGEFDNLYHFDEAALPPVENPPTEIF